MGVDLLPQVVLDRERNPAGDDPPDHGQAESQHGGPEDRPGQPVELLHVALFDRVDGEADQQRDQHRHADRHPGKDHRTPQGATVGSQESEQSPEGGHPPNYTK